MPCSYIETKLLMRAKMQRNSFLARALENYSNSASENGLKQTMNDDPQKNEPLCDRVQRCIAKSCNPNSTACLLVLLLHHHHPPPPPPTTTTTHHHHHHPPPPPPPLPPPTTTTHHHHHHHHHQPPTTTTTTTTQLLAGSNPATARLTAGALITI
jgi:hypothetical protein